MGLFLIAQVILIPIQGLLFLGALRERQKRDALLKQFFEDKYQSGFRGGRL